MTERTRETDCVQAMGAIDADTGALVPPIHVSTTFERAPDNAYPKGFVYSRPDNATTQSAEAVISRLEGGARTMLFGSGMAAAVSLFLALPRPAHIVAPDVMYWGLRSWLRNEAPGHGLSVSFVDGTSLEAISSAIRTGETRLIWLETPSNPMWSLSDIAGVAQIGRDAGALVGVDSTTATPVLTQPLQLGADIVMHSATKYLNGHSDVLAGSLTFADAGSDIAGACARVRGGYGAILGPFEAALLLRGLRTLFVRVARQCETAMAFAEAFEGHPAISAVLYPGLESHPQHALAREQMRGGFGGMLSLRFGGGAGAAISAAARLKTIKRATSLGGIESLVEHRASIEGEGSPCPDDLLRFSIGLENAGDLIGDLRAAL